LPRPDFPPFWDDCDDGDGFLKKEEKKPFFLPGEPDTS
jgi:hypothetical protein